MPDYCKEWINTRPEALEICSAGVLLVARILLLVRKEHRSEALLVVSEGLSELSLDLLFAEQYVRLEHLIWHILLVMGLALQMMVG